MQRKRAANDIATLDSDSVGIEELPAAGRPKETQSAAPAAPAPTPAAAPPQRAISAPSSAVAPSTSVPKRKPADAKGGLVRDTPF